MDEDPLLIRCALAGDAKAFRRLVERHAPALIAWTRHLAGEVHAGEDLAQEALLRAWQHLRTWDEARGTFKGWLFQIARNAARNAVRRRRPAPWSAAPELASWDPAPRAEEEAVHALLDRELARLPEAQQACFLLAEVHGLSLAEVAAVEGVPLGTVKSRVARARDALGEALTRARGLNP